MEFRGPRLITCETRKLDEYKEENDQEPQITVKITKVRAKDTRQARNQGCSCV